MAALAVAGVVRTARVHLVLHARRAADSALDLGWAARARLAMTRPVVALAPALAALAVGPVAWVADPVVVLAEWAAAAAMVEVAAEAVDRIK